MERDLKSMLAQVLALNVQVIASDTTTVGKILDSKGFEGIDFACFTGVLTDGDYQFKLFHGDAVDDEDNPTSITDESEVTDANDLIGSIPNYDADTDDNKIEHFGYVGKKRWTLLKVVSTNFSATGAVIGAIATKGFASHRPTT